MKTKSVKIPVAYLCESMQSASDAGLNPFAIKLIAESFGDKLQTRFTEGAIMFSFPFAHDGTPVWVVVTAQAPEIVQEYQADGN